MIFLNHFQIFLKFFFLYKLLLEQICAKVFYSYLLRNLFAFAELGLNACINPILLSEIIRRFRAVKSHIETSMITACECNYEFSWLLNRSENVKSFFLYDFRINQKCFMTLEFFTFFLSLGIFISELV